MTNIRLSNIVINCNLIGDNLDYYDDINDTSVNYKINSLFNPHASINWVFKLKFKVKPSIKNYGVQFSINYQKSWM